MSHNRILVTLTSPDGSDSESVRRNVFEGLMSDNSFCGDGGRFHSPLCDWFVIGGSFSGLLAETAIGGAFTAAVRTRFPDMDRQYLPQSIIDTHAPYLDAIWQSLGGTGPNPFSRSSYGNYGYDDDAVLLTRDLYAALLAQYEGRADGDGFADLDNEDLQPDFVGRKWLVVVDYHN